MVDRLPAYKQAQLFDIGQANPAAIGIAARLYIIGASDNYDYFDALQRLDIKGVNLWILYKNDCDQSDARLIEVIKSKITELESS
tara:strand:+ start:194 stop:448 length:255 start_codon:yes stop_codon:yes gene_type:complete